MLKYIMMVLNITYHHYYLSPTPIPSQQLAKPPNGPNMKTLTDGSHNIDRNDANYVPQTQMSSPYWFMICVPQGTQFTIVQILLLLNLDPPRNHARSVWMTEIYNLHHGYGVHSVTGHIHTCVFGGLYRFYRRNGCFGSLFYKNASFLRLTAPSLFFLASFCHDSTYFPAAHRFTFSFAFGCLSL